MKKKIETKEKKLYMLFDVDYWIIFYKCNNFLDLILHTDKTEQKYMIYEEIINSSYFSSKNILNTYSWLFIHYKF